MTTFDQITVRRTDGGDYAVHGIGEEPTEREVAEVYLQGAPVTLDGGASLDIDGDALSLDVTDGTARISR